MSQGRHQRVADEIRAELARLLHEEVRDPQIGFVTLTEVHLSDDLRHARVFFSVLGAEDPPTLSALSRATPFLKRRLGRLSGLRFTPELRFEIDRSVASGARVESLLRELRDERDDDESDSS